MTASSVPLGSPRRGYPSSWVAYLRRREGEPSSPSLATTERRLIGHA